MVRSRNIILVAALVLLAVARQDAKAQSPNEPVRLKQGDILMGEIPADLAVKDAEAILEKNGKRVRNAAIFEKDGGWFFLLPIALKDAPGEYKLKILCAKNRCNFSEKMVFVDRGDFPVSKSTVWGAKSLTAKELTRFKAEKAALAKAYRGGVKKALWTQTGFMLPIEAKNGNGKVLSVFGKRRINPKNGYGRFHFGADIRGRRGTPIHAMADGVIAHVGRNYLFEGNITVIDHGAGVFSAYLHQAKTYVRKDQFVKKGEIIGKVGQTGNAIGAHLHLAVKINGVPVDPIKLAELLKN